MLVAFSRFYKDGILIHACIFALYNLTQPLSSALVAVLAPSLLQTYFPTFHACVSEGGAKSIMCSYNAVNGVPSCANSLFQNTAVRDQWGFDGYIVSERPLPLCSLIALQLVIPV